MVKTQKCELLNLKMKFTLWRKSTKISMSFPVSCSLNPHEHMHMCMFDYACDLLVQHLYEPKMSSFHWGTFITFVIFKNKSAFCKNLQSFLVLLILFNRCLQIPSNGIKNSAFFKVNQLKIRGDISLRIEGGWWADHSVCIFDLGSAHSKGSFPHNLHWFAPSIPLSPVNKHN